MTLIDPEARASGVTAGFYRTGRPRQLGYVARARSGHQLHSARRAQRLFKPSGARLNLIAVTAHYKGRDSVVKVLRDIPAP